MNNPVEDIDNLIDSLTSLKRAINKFNRNSYIVKIHNEIDNDGFKLFIFNTTKKDFNKLTKKQKCILDPFYNPHYDDVDMYIGIYLHKIKPKTIKDLILIINRIFECLNPETPKKSKLQEHCELASELYNEWPQWKKDATKHVPYTYEPPYPQ